MEYNTSRSKMSISEYGRNIQKMIEFTATIEDKEKRNRLAKAIINVMGQLNPHLRDVNDFKHKLWDHLFIMSDFKLEVDSPYPIPSRDILHVKPEKLSYPHKNIKYKHYGKNIEFMIAKAIEMEESDEKNILIKMIANQMKKSYIAWNKESVTDETIFEHLEKMSNGKLKINEDFNLNRSKDIMARTKKKVINHPPFNQNRNNQNRNNNNNNNNRKPFSK